VVLMNTLPVACMPVALASGESGLFPRAGHALIHGTVAALAGIVRAIVSHDLDISDDDVARPAQAQMAVQLSAANSHERLPPVVPCTAPPMGRPVAPALPTAPPEAGFAPLLLDPEQATAELTSKR
jgi:hypothetical protein